MNIPTVGSGLATNSEKGREDDYERIFHDRSPKK